MKIDLKIKLFLLIVLGTFVDALIGQWWSYFLGLGPLLPVDHIRSHLKYVFERNHVEEFDLGKLDLILTVVVNLLL